MKRLLPVLALLAVACPKNNPDSNVAGTDDEQLDRYSAQIEEMHARIQAGEPKCSDWREMAKKMCDITRQVCAIADRHKDRDDIAKKCGSTQEDCANYNGSSTNCKG